MLEDKYVPEKCFKAFHSFGKFFFIFPSNANRVQPVPDQIFSLLFNQKIILPFSYRMNFGELEEDIYQNDLGYTRGNIGKGGIGAGIRMAQIDERTRIRASQTLKKNLQKEQATYGGATTVKKQISGTASSVAFTPYQGLEIVNPQASAEKRAEEANAKYFSSSGAFMKVKTPLPGSLP